MIVDNKVTSADTVNKWISSLDDVPQLSGTQMKEMFDAVPRVLVAKHNALIDSLLTDYATKSDVESAVTGQIDVSSELTVSVDKSTFKIAVSNAPGTYEFSYDGSDWELNEHTVILSSYGISVEETPSEGDEITVLFSITSAENVMSKEDYVNEGGEGIVLKSVEAGNGINLYTMTTTGVVHAIAGNGTIGYFIPDVDFVSDNMFTVNGNQVTVKTLDGQSLPNGAFKANEAALFIVLGGTIYFVGLMGNDDVSHIGKLKIGDDWYSATYDDDTHTLSFN